MAVEFVETNFLLAVLDNNAEETRRLLDGMTTHEKQELRKALLRAAVLVDASLNLG